MNDEQPKRYTEAQWEKISDVFRIIRRCVKSGRLFIVGRQTVDVVEEVDGTDYPTWYLEHRVSEEDKVEHLAVMGELSPETEHLLYVSRNIECSYEQTMENLRRIMRDNGLRRTFTVVCVPDGMTYNGLGADDTYLQVVGNGSPSDFQDDWATAVEEVKEHLPEEYQFEDVLDHVRMTPGRDYEITFRPEPDVTVEF